MSVWKKIESKVLAAGVNMELFEKSLKEELGVTLDFNTKNIRNTWGSETVDCALVVDGRVRALGFRFSKEDGVELVGDSYGSGIRGIGDNKQEALMNKIAQFYQKHNIKNKLEQSGWIVEDITVDEKQQIVIDAYQW